MKDHKEMLSAIRRGDTIITGGGITGKVTKVDNELEVTVEIAKDVKVKVQRSLISGVQVKGDPVKSAAPANENANQKASGGGLGKLFGLGNSKQDGADTNSSRAAEKEAGDSEITDGTDQNNSDAGTKADNDKKQ